MLSKFGTAGLMTYLMGIDTPRQLDEGTNVTGALILAQLQKTDFLTQAQGKDSQEQCRSGGGKDKPSGKPEITAACWKGEDE